MVQVTQTIWPEGVQKFSDELLDRLKKEPKFGVTSDEAQESVTVTIADHSDCDSVATIVAEWLASTTADFRLKIDGPIEHGELRAIRTEYDQRFLSSLLAVAANLQ